MSLERAMSGVFHRDASGNVISSIPSRMSMQERREFHKTHNPEWVLKSVTHKGNNPIEEFLRAGGKGFAMAFVGKALVSAVLGLMARRKPKEILSLALGADTVRFATFFGSYTGLLRAVNALMCNTRNRNDRWNAIVAGLIAGFTLMIDDPERRRIVAIYVFVRAMSVLVKGLSRERVLPYNEHAESILFGLVNMPIMYGFLLEPEILDRGYYRWILGMGAITHEGLDVTLRQRFHHHLKTGEWLPFRSCQPHYHCGSCVGYCTHDWFLGLGRAGKIYAPVHLLPLLIFRYQKLMKDPKKQLTETGMAWIYSCMFLTTYQFTVKFSQCMLRNTRQRDVAWHALLSGLLTGFACLFERPSRVSELMLYCVPKSLEACWNYGVRHFGFQAVPNFELPLFVVGNAILLSALKEDLKSTYFNAVSFIVTGEFKKGETEDKTKRGTSARVKDMPIEETDD